MNVLDDYISDKSYMIGFEPSTADQKVFELVNIYLRTTHEKTHQNENPFDSINETSRVTFYFLLDIN